MTIDTDNLINSILESLDRIPFIKPEDIPQLDLYMDQLTTFMDSRLRRTSRYPDGDKILTKTMINNYAKNDLLPPPVKKKYTSEHIMLLVFIYYFKGFLSINDIRELLGPISDKYFQNGKEYDLEEVYKEIFKDQQVHIEAIKKDIQEKYEMAQETYRDAPEEDSAFLKEFAFIGYLGFDVYIKKLLIEKMVDDMAEKRIAAQKQLEKEQKEQKEAKKKEK